jgi:glycine/D-amino acid oxidase-like deaminating enzyme
VIAGFGGHGLPAGLGAGIALAQAIATNQTIPALAAFDPARLKFQTTKEPSRVT